MCRCRDWVEAHGFWVHVTGATKSQKVDIPKGCLSCRQLHLHVTDKSDSDAPERGSQLPCELRGSNPLERPPPPHTLTLWLVAVRLCGRCLGGTCPYTTMPASTGHTRLPGVCVCACVCSHMCKARVPALQALVCVCVRARVRVISCVKSLRACIAGVRVCARACVRACKAYVLVLQLDRP